MDALTRRKRMIELLNKNKNMSASNLAIALNVSDRTIRNDKNFINSLFEETVVESNASVGYFINEKLKVSKIKDALNCLNWSDNQEVLELILMAFLFEESLSISELSEQSFTSESSIYSIISDLNDQFEEKDLHLYVDKNIVKLEIPEINFRSLVVSDKDASLSYNSILENLDNSNYDEFENLIEKINHLFEGDSNKMNQNLYNDFKKHLLISYIRKSMFGHSVCLDDTTDYKISIHPEIQGLISRFNLDLEYLILIHDYLFRTGDYQNIEYEKDVLLEIFNESNIVHFNTLKTDEMLMKNLGLHLSHLRMQKNLKIKSNNQLLTNIKREYSLPFEIAYFISLEIEKKIGLRMDEHDIGFVALHIASSLEEEKKDDAVVSKGIILSDHRKSIQFLALEKLNKYLRDEVKINLVVNSNEFNESYLADVDYIFLSENYILDKFDKKIIQDITIFEISPIPTDKEIKEIQTTVFNKKPPLVHKQIKKLLDPKIFKKNIQAKNKKEALNKVLELMENSEFISEETVKGIISRERASPTEIGNLVAIPHTVSRVDESCIGMYLLDKPIKWDREYVQLIVIIVINENNLIKWEEVFTWIFDYFVDGFGIKDLLEDFDYEKFISSIK